MSSQFVPPKDTLTKDAYEIWEHSRPAYHDLNGKNLWKFDAQDWSNRIRKYRLETIANVDRIKKLELEIEKLEENVEDEEEVVQIEEKAKELEGTSRELKKILHQNEVEKKQLTSEKLALSKYTDGSKKSLEKLENESESIFYQIQHLKNENELIDEKQKMTTDEAKLRYEREWFQKERELLMLSKTNAPNLDELKNHVSQIRKSMQKSWAYSKKFDVLGHLRATKVIPGEDQWYDERKRRFSVSKRRSSVEAS
eukprot:GHVP01011265.1.p1 GENE.GHVP01011265.1~~GHVP01011265.1.p1  ORF type:complete len:254 (-),score=67.32 GHVP01011265.1:39-800(-)